MRYPPPVDRPHGRLARERVVTVAAALIGLDYQHHHVPSWAPPADWPHKPVRSGRRGPGMDCSNFIGFVYSYALGVDLPTGVGAQSELHRSISEGSLFSRRVQVLPAGDYDAFVIDVEDTPDGGTRLDLTITAGEHKGGVVSIASGARLGDPVDLIGMPATITVAFGAPSVTIDR